MKSIVFNNQCFWFNLKDPYLSIFLFITDTSFHQDEVESPPWDSDELWAWEWGAKFSQSRLKLIYL